MRLSQILILAGSAALLAGFLLWRWAPDADLAIFQFLRLDPRSPAVAPVQLFTAGGGFAVLGPLALAVVAWLFARGRGAEALWLFATVGGGRLMIEALKAALARPRPPLVDRLAEVSTQSFPSSHTAGTLLTWLAIAILFSPLRSWLPPFALAMAAAIGWSRIALGVHWPGDVIAGYGFALLWVGVAARWLPPGRSGAISPA